MELAIVEHCVVQDLHKGWREHNTHIYSFVSYPNFGISTCLQLKQYSAECGCGNFDSQYSTSANAVPLFRNLDAIYAQVTN